MLLVTDLETEYSASPLGIGVRHPRCSWKLVSERRGARQTAYRIEAARDAVALRVGRADADSGEVVSDASRYRPCPGAPLVSRERRWWRVAVRDEFGDWSDWSEPVWCEAGLLDASDWQADWIAAPGGSTDRSAPLPIFASSFDLAMPVLGARLYASALGLYTLWLNGAPIGDAVLTPGWTSFAHRLPYQTYDISHLVRPGRNRLAAMLGRGWWGCSLGLGPQDRSRAPFGDRLALRVQLEIEAEGGTRRLVVPRAADWCTASGPILAADLYDGERSDRRVLPGGWPDCDPAGPDWTTAEVAPDPGIALVASEAPPVRRTASLAPAALDICGNETIVDFGQIVTGWVALDVEGVAGQEIRIRHAERLDAEGGLYTANLRTAEASDHYILRGGPEHLEPQFTFHGFRYAAIRGLGAPLQREAVRAIVVHSDMEATGHFTCSDPLLAKLDANIRWGQRGNFVDVPTDCPQRDERQGWTGDAQAFAPTAALNFDVRGFFAKWLGDLALDQGDDGSVSWVVPDIFGKREQFGEGGLRLQTPQRGGAAGWGDAATFVPWALYRAYGDLDALRRQFPSMRGWADYQASRAGASFVWRGDFQFGDWLDFFAKDRGSNFGSTPEDLVATAYFARSTAIVAAAAQALGDADVAAAYRDRFARIAAAFQAAFSAPSGIVGSGTQAGYVLALDFNLLPPEIRPLAAARLAEDVRARGHLTTGFLGTPALLHILARFGYLDEAYALLLRRDFPSWLYPVTQGATTIWERWDGVKPDGSLADPQMNSFNHYAYGAVGAWLYQTVAGIAPDDAAPGYRRLRAAPQPGGGLSWAAASLEGPYGLIESRWSLDADRFRYMLAIPPGSEAIVTLPGARADEVSESGARLGEAPGIANIENGEGVCRFEAAAGRYLFDYPMRGM